jgi:mannose-1-phosphate guanylyltransferase/phosphomannomutase
MPDLLAKLGAEVLALNPYVSTMGVVGFDRQVHAANVAKLVQASGADLGAVIAPDGEDLTLVDDTGRVLDDTQALLAMLVLVADRIDGDRIALPVNTTRAAERLLGDKGVAVEYTKLASSALMEAATEKGVGFAASPAGGYIVPGFLPAFDAAATFVKLLDLLAPLDRPLSDVVTRLPAVHVTHRTIVTPWEQKGTVMRDLVERSVDRDVLLVDGVKVSHEDGWVLALPDPEEPVTHVWAEGPDDASADRLAEEYARRIRQMAR